MSRNFATNSSTVSPLGDEKEPKAVPGSDKRHAWQMLMFLLHGQGHFKRRMKSCRSSVFRVFMGVKGIAICDRKGLDTLFDNDKVYKAPAFGRLNYNLGLLDAQPGPVNNNRAPLIGAHTPSMFSNGVPHEQKKAFTMKICQLAQEARLLVTCQKVIQRYLIRWRDADAKLKQGWELDIRALASDIFSEALLGVRLNSNAMYNMLKGSWAKGSKLKKAVDSACHLRETFKNCPKLVEILKIAEETGVSEDQAIADVLFMLNFNAYGGTSGVIIGCLARLKVADPNYKEEMTKEIIKALDADGVSYKAIEKMKKLHCFVLEAIRLSPPVPVLFGRARYDFTLESSYGNFQVKKDELLVGNVYEIQRDQSVFKHEPDSFNPSRFENESEREELYKSIVFLNGQLTETATTKNHYCPGKDLIFTVVKMVMINVIVCCDYMLTRVPVWTGKKLRRVGSPDNIVKLKYFRYFPQFPLIQQLEEDMQVSDIENGNEQFDTGSLAADSNASKSHTSFRGSQGQSQT